MQTLVHSPLTLTSLVLVRGRKLFRHFTATLPFSLLPGEEGCLPDAAEAWGRVAKTLADAGILDTGSPKPGREWLMAGDALSASPVEGLRVEVMVGDLFRTFYVCGERVDTGSGPVRPVPFTRMPLDWSHAACAPSNPVGKGTPAADGTRTLPNVCRETAGGDLDETTPVCPGPISPLYRDCSTCGTLDADWLTNHWPGPPADFDPELFHLAQKEQRGQGRFRGDEPVLVTNMNAEYPRLESRLPGLRLRLFVDYLSMDPKTGEPVTGDPAASAAGAVAPENWREVEVHPDTVWLFPNSGLGMVLWHAAAPTLDERGSDMRRVAACLERMDGPKKPLEKLLEETGFGPAELTGPPAADEAVPPAAAPEAAVAGSPAPAAAAAPSAPPVPPVPKAPETPDEPAPSQLSGEDVRAFEQEMLDEIPGFLAEVNPILEGQGLPPVTAEALRARVSARAADMARMADRLRTTEAADPTDILVGAGLSPERAKGILAAAELVPPLRSDMVSDEAYREAVKAFGDRFAKLTGARPKEVNALLESLEKLDEEPVEESAESVLRTATDTAGDADGFDGLSPELSAALKAAGIDAPSPACVAAMKAFEGLPDVPGEADMALAVRNFALALNLDPATAENTVTSSLASTRAQLYRLPETRETLADLALLAPDSRPGIEELATLLAKPAQTLAPMLRGKDLAALAAECGVTDPLLLDALRATDPLPFEEPKQVPTEDQAGNLPAGTLPEGAAGGGAPGNPADGDGIAADAPGSAPSSLSPDPAEGASALSSSGDALSPAGEELPQSRLPFADFSGRDLTGLDFSGRDLSGARFDGAVLCGCVFAGASLRGAGLAGADLTGADLTDCDLTGSDCTGALFADTKLVRVKAADAGFAKARFENAHLTGFSAENAVFEDAVAQNQDFSKARDLTGAVFQGADLRNADFTKVPLAGATFQNCDLHAARFKGACLKEARLYGSDLHRADFSGADLRSSSWLSCKGQGARLTAATLSSATLEECVFHASDLSRLDARECRFLSCDLRGSDLRGCDLFQGALRDCRLEDCDLSHSSLWEGDLFHIFTNRGTRFTDCDLGRCRATPAE